MTARSRGASGQHSGYSGTIAEKQTFTIAMAGIYEPDRAMDLAEGMIAAGDARIDNTWGPAGCLQIGAEEWLFFGWASS